LVKDDPRQARSLFEQVLLVFPADPEPLDAWQLLGCADSIAKIDSAMAATACERVLAAASRQDYGDGKRPVTARFGKVETTNSRDSLLAAAGSRLLKLAPEKAAAYQAQLSRWDLTDPAFARTTSLMIPPGTSRPPEVAALAKRMSELRGDLPDRERAKLAIEIARQIAAMPGGDPKLSLAAGLANLSTEGDLGREALAAVSATLSLALRECPGSVDRYLKLASLVRYENVPAPDDAPERAAEALLELREQIHATAGFTLTALDGKTYTLAGLRGKVVLLNFWATWCPPCRKEMPDMEKLSRAFAGKGLVVLAVSDEPRETVAPFIEKAGYSFPVLLDPERKVHDAFDVSGIPKSFIFDREGRIAALAIDMRTEAQFRELLKRAGL
jgi:peroxiredoxin